MRWLRFLLLLSLLTTIVGCDHTTKHLARTHLGGRQTLDVVPGVLDLHVVKNTDTAFGLLAEYLDGPVRLVVILTLVTLSTVAILIAIAWRWRRASFGERVAGVVLLGGAFGNLADRYLHGHVVDFIHLHYWPVFNVADIALCVGAGLLLLTARRGRAPAPT